MTIQISISQRKRLQIVPPSWINDKVGLVMYLDGALKGLNCFNGKGFRFVIQEAKLLYAPASEILNTLSDDVRSEVSIIGTHPYPNGLYIKALEEEIRTNKTPYINPLQVPFSVNNSVTGWIALKYGLRGGNLTFNSSNSLASVISAIEFIGEQISLNNLSYALLLAGSFGGLYLSNLLAPIQTYAFLIEKGGSGINVSIQKKLSTWQDLKNYLRNYSSPAVIIESAIAIPDKIDGAIILRTPSESPILCELLFSPYEFLANLGISNKSIIYVAVNSLRSINILEIEC
jgi:hypothetical protein